MSENKKRWMSIFEITAKMIDKMDDTMIKYEAFNEYKEMTMYQLKKEREAIEKLFNDLGEEIGKREDTLRMKRLEQHGYFAMDRALTVEISRKEVLEEAEHAIEVANSVMRL